MLAEDAIKAAVKDYEAKRGKNGDNTEKAAAEAWLYYICTKVLAKK